MHYVRVLKEKFEGLGYSKRGEDSWLEGSTEEVTFKLGTEGCMGVH